MKDVFLEGYQCAVNIIDKYDVSDETKTLFQYIYSDEWIEIAEFGSRASIVENLGQAVDPMAKKIMHADGERVIGSMPVEMIEWIKDTTILWIKNKGAGNSTTEAEVK